jgi:hypothetical protein
MIPKVCFAGVFKGIPTRGKMRAEPNLIRRLSWPFLPCTGLCPHSFNTLRAYARFKKKSLTLSAQFEGLSTSELEELVPQYRLHSIQVDVDDPLAVGR